MFAYKVQWRWNWSCSVNCEAESLVMCSFTRGIQNLLQQEPCIAAETDSWFAGRGVLRMISHTQPRLRYAHPWHPSAFVPEPRVSIPEITLSLYPDNKTEPAKHVMSITFPFSIPDPKLSTPHITQRRIMRQESADGKKSQCRSQSYCRL